MAKRMRQRHEDLASARLFNPHMILDDGIAARKSMFVAQPLENPLGRMTLLHRRCPVGFPIMTVMMVVVTRLSVMGRFSARPTLTFFGWAGTALMAVTVVALFWSSIG
jgi:hypothetical protein